MAAAAGGSLVPAARQQHCAQVRSRRLMKELRDIARLSDRFISVELVDESLFDWNVKLHQVDKDSVLWQDMKETNTEFILLNLTFPDNFPFSPPFMRVLSPRLENGYVLDGGAICMELLTPRGWSSAYTVEAVMRQFAASLVKGQVSGRAGGSGGARGALETCLQRGDVPRAPPLDLPERFLPCPLSHPVAPGLRLSRIRVLPPAHPPVSPPLSFSPIDPPALPVHLRSSPQTRCLHPLMPFSPLPLHHLRLLPPSLPPNPPLSSPPVPFRPRPLPGLLRGLPISCSHNLPEGETLYGSHLLNVQPSLSPPRPPHTQRFTPPPNSSGMPCELGGGGCLCRGQLPAAESARWPCFVLTGI